jgi:CheY-like chemotaxis protein
MTPTQIPPIDETAQWIVLRLRPLADEDWLDFADEDAGEVRQRQDRPWSILVVDDDDEVHRAIALALMSVRICGRPVALSHCVSAADARSLLGRQDAGVDLVLLDVVMESADAGLTLLDELRQQPETKALPILLHTGQPGHAPERVVRANYDISGYLTKSTVTRDELVATLDKVLGRALPPG